MGENLCTTHYGKYLVLVQKFSFDKKQNKTKMLVLAENGKIQVFFYFKVILVSIWSKLD